tara:strand:- start:517 stop:1470 length:954 start_codon:yes stop_codon:yes gene_type:complete
MNSLNNKSIFFSILITPLLFSQSADDVLLDYMKKEFNQESADYEIIKEKYYNSIEAGEVDAEAAYEVSEYLTKLMIQAGIEESSDGDGLKEMIAKSLQLSVSNGYHKAIPNYARLFLLGWYYEEDFETFDLYMRMAAKKDLIEGIAYIGEYVFLGKTQEEKEEGLKYLKIAAERNHTSSIFKLGRVYLDGNLLKKDYEEGISYIELAHKRNDNDATKYLCEAYVFEDKQFLNKAIDICQINAAKGDMMNQYALSWAYSLTSDMVKCYAWTSIGFSNASSKKEKEFSERFNVLKNICFQGMTSSQVKRANDLVKKLLK